jgi:hypothetical protein
LDQSASGTARIGGTADPLLAVVDRDARARMIDQAPVAVVERELDCALVLAGPAGARSARNIEAID